MKEFQFYDEAAEMKIANEVFVLPLTDATLANMRGKAEKLLALVLGAGHDDEEEITEAIIEAIDGILGAGSCERIMASSRKFGMMDALEVFTFICGEFTGAWRERLISMTCRSM